MSVLGHEPLPGDDIPPLAAHGHHASQHIADQADGHAFDLPKGAAVASTPLNLLLVEDNPADAMIVRRLLADSRPEFVLRRATRLSHAEEVLRRTPPDVVLLDLTLPDSRGISTVERATKAAPTVPIVVLTGCDNEEWGRRAIQASAQDYLVKGRIDRSIVVRTLTHAIERNRLQQQLFESEASFRHLIEASADGILLLDRSDRVQLVNPAGYRLLQGGGDKLIGERLEAPWAGPQALQEVATAGGHAVEIRRTRVTWRGQPMRMLTLHDVSERRRSEQAQRVLFAELQQANEKLSELVHLDPLTELPNRRALEQALDTEIARVRRSGSALAALLLDCDDFKRINDRLGHAAGDAVLAQIAARIRHTVRTTDHVARIGGDEFLILLPGASLWEGMHFAERIRLAIASSPVLSTPEPVTVTISTGCCRVPQSSSSVEEVLALTRLALKRSKALGKNRVSGETFADEVACREQRTEVVAQLCKGNVFNTVSQRIVCLRDDSLAGYELLSRSSVVGLESPSDFFRTCLESNVLTYVDLACLKTSIAATRALRHPITVHVNIFPSTILSTPTDALCRLFSSGSQQVRFCLEVSEQQCICDPRELRRKLDALREHGVLIALDDVGFGRTSLELLIMVEPNVVKIDGEFVRGASRDASQRKALGRLVRVIDTLKADLVAEGIETPEHLDIVRQTGVPYGQGFMWGQPGELA